MTDQSNPTNKLLPVLTVALIGAAFAVGLLYGKVSVYESGGAANQGANQGAGNQPDPNQPPAAPEVTELDDESWLSLLVDPAAAAGSQDAPVTIVEFSSYQCPFCASFHKDSYVQLKSDYIDQGSVRYIVRDLPLVDFQFNSRPAALAARCAGDQDNYFEMQAALYEAQSVWASLSDPAEAFEGLAQDIGLNTSTFNSCYTSEKYGDAVDADLALAGRVGASGTPTFFINGTKLVGAQPISAFKALIDPLLE